MKLVSLYIENFGGLSGYSLDFARGVTVIAEPNGFGKTTLAEFIRAMFYGFPRKTKTLDKSKRQKYTPWNGGKCGGNLVFEYENQRYRIERTFGATPKGDTFRVIDLATSKKTDRFSEEIGLELFQLDADSFERSTYMPQLSGSGSLSTNSIQAKLTRLVEDAGDINNFDKAMETLRSKRSTFIPYRGNGGTVAQARSRISMLQQELDQAEKKREDLQACQENTAQLEERLHQCEAAISAVRRDITAASEAAAAAALRREYDQLLSRKQADQQLLEQLQARYPGGVPEDEKINAAETAARQLAVLEGRRITDERDLEAKSYADQNRTRFEGKVPDQEQLEKRRRQHRDYESALTEVRSIGLTGQEQMQYENLLPLYQEGKLDQQRLDNLSEMNRELEKLRSGLEHTVMDPAEEQKLEQLEGYFVSGAPRQQEIDEIRGTLQARRQLQQQTEQLAAAIPAPQPRKTVSPVPMILALLLGAAAAAAGVALLVQKLYLAGGLVLGIAVISLTAGVFLGLRMMVSRELAGNAAQVNPQLRARIDANKDRMEQYESQINGFTGRSSALQDPAEALREIEDLAGDYEMLRQRRAVIEARRENLQAGASRLEARLREELGCASGDFGRAIMDLYLWAGQFADLQSEKQAADIRCRELEAQAENLRKDLTRYLATFYDDVTPERFGVLLARLQRESEAYVRCSEQVKTWEDRCRAHEAEVGKYSGQLDDFFRSFGQKRDSDVLGQLQEIRSDSGTARQIFARSPELNSRLEELRSQHGDLLSAPQPEQIGDLDNLKWQERQLSGQQTVLTRQLLQEKQLRIQLREEVDRIPALRDEQELWNAQKNGDQKKAAVLDDTMDFLEKAKDSLSCSYLGPIREHFAGYLNRLAGGEQTRSLISPELEIQLERQGQARELAYFSAGQTDLVMLCMRLALVDALFGDWKPFIILDDPFVNLDDERTAEALALLQELGEDRQILYLVCNSSRKL